MADIKVSKTQIFVGVVIVALLAFGYWSFTGKNRAERRALVAEGAANLAKENLEVQAKALDKIIKAKDVIIAEERKTRQKLEAERDDLERLKNDILKKYNDLLGKIAVMPPDEVVTAINTRVKAWASAAGQQIGAQASLLVSGNVEMLMPGARFTLAIFGAGARDAESLAAEKLVTTNLTASNNSLLKTVAALMAEVAPLKKFKVDCTDSLDKMTVDRDAWKKAFTKSSGWLKAETTVIGVTVVVIILKVLKVF